MARILRVGLPILLCATGFGLVTYGVLGHAVTVVQDQEIEKPLSELEPNASQDPFSTPEDEFGPPQDSWGPSEDSWGPPRNSWGPPDAQLPRTVMVLERHTFDEHEPALIRDVTRDGLALLDSGEVIRTYKPGDAPALCHT